MQVTNLDLNELYYDLNNPPDGCSVLMSNPEQLIKQNWKSISCTIQNPVICQANQSVIVPSSLRCLSTTVEIKTSWFLLSYFKVVILLYFY